MAVLQLEPQGTNVDLLTTELNSLALNTPVVSSVGGTSGVFNNQFGGTTNLVGYAYGTVVCRLAALAGACNATAIKLWFLRSWDGGTTFETGSSTRLPRRHPDVVFFPEATASAQDIIGVNGTGDPVGRESARVRLPAGHFKCLFYWPNGGQALASSGNTVEVLANTDETV